MKDHYLVVKNFFDQAEEMRFQYENHFNTPYVRSGTSHQLWDYWQVPEMYTYLRTNPDRVVGSSLIENFLEKLTNWATEVLGMKTVTVPYISVYVNGCVQGLHNDVKNGRWAYVYSLTRWEERRFIGGETLIFKESNYWESEEVRNAGAGLAFYDLIPAVFNQLVVFDDRLIHGVPQIQGNMNPLEGRVVLHGHIEEGGIGVNGSLSEEEVTYTITEIMPELKLRIQEFGSAYHGFATFHITVTPDGAIETIRILSDRVLSTSLGDRKSEALVQNILEYLQKVKFSISTGKTFVILPIIIDN